MAKHTCETLTQWFRNCGGLRPSHSLALLQFGIRAGYLNEQDESGLTALGLAISSNWLEGLDALLAANANTELRYFRTGETPLHQAAHARKDAFIRALLAAGANSDAANYWGVTPRISAAHVGVESLFAAIQLDEIQWPTPHIQNAEHLADHYHPHFRIPPREERETLRVGQAIDLIVYGPKVEAKQDRVKVRITARRGRRPNVCYAASVETAIERTHLASGTVTVEFGPENIATVYVPDHQVET